MVFIICRTNDINSYNVCKHFFNETFTDSVDNAISRLKATSFPDAKLVISCILPRKERKGSIQLNRV